jgi:hypothetical protein
MPYDFDLQAIRQLQIEAEARRRAEAPTNRAELQGRLLFSIGIPMAALYEPASPMFRGESPARNRFEALWNNDAFFRHCLHAAIMDVMLLLEDTDRKTGRQPLR